MANSDPFVQKVLHDLSPLGDVSARPMFGGHGVFVGGRMFALIAKDVLYLKADDANRGEFEAAGIKPYGKMPYYQAPATTLQNPEQLVALGGAAAAASFRGERKNKKGKYPAILELPCQTRQTAGRSFHRSAPNMPHVPGWTLLLERAFPKHRIEPRKPRLQ